MNVLRKILAWIWCRVHVHVITSILFPSQALSWLWAPRYHAPLHDLHGGMGGGCRAGIAKQSSHCQAITAEERHASLGFLLRLVIYLHRFEIECTDSAHERSLHVLRQHVASLLLCNKGTAGLHQLQLQAVHVCLLLRNLVLQALNQSQTFSCLHFHVDTGIEPPSLEHSSLKCLYCVPVKRRPHVLHGETASPPIHQAAVNHAKRLLPYHSSAFFCKLRSCLRQPTTALQSLNCVASNLLKRILWLRSAMSPHDDSKIPSNSEFRACPASSSVARRSNSVCLDCNCAVHARRSVSTA